MYIQESALKCRLYHRLFLSSVCLAPDSSKLVALLED